MEDSILIIEGENHTIKSLIEMADKDNRKVVIVGSHSELVQHTETIKKFSRGSVGIIALCITQLATADQNKIKAMPAQNSDPFSNGSITEALLEQTRKLSLELTRLPEPIMIHECDQRRKVKHPQAKPIRQFIPAHKNHHFKRK